MINNARLQLLSEHPHEAFALINRIIEFDPKHSEANELLAYIYSSQGDATNFYKFLKIACAQENCSQDALYNLGSFYLKNYQYIDAIEAFKNCLSKGNELFNVVHDLGTAYANIGNFHEALNCYRKCLNSANNSHELHYNIGRIFDELGQHDNAVLQFDKAIEIQPDFLQAYLSKADALFNLNKFKESVLSFKKAISISPGNSEAWYGVANTNKILGELDEALVHYNRAIELQPDFVQAWCNRGLTLHELKRFDEALVHYNRAIELQPDFVQAWCNKCAILIEVKNFIDALFCFKKILRMNADTKYIYGSYLTTKLRLSDWSDLNESLFICIDKINNNKNICQPFDLLCLVDQPDLHKKNSENFIKSNYSCLTKYSLKFKNQNNKKIRVAYFSADFRHHPVSYLIAELPELHDKNYFEVFAFSFGPDDKSLLRSQLIKSFPNFFDVSNLSDAEIINLSRDHKIDIAIDLMGHTQLARTNIFANRVAPIQINYLGYPGTSGANFIDYIIADRVLIPPELEVHYNEKIIFLPNSYQVNDSRDITNYDPICRKDVGLEDDQFVFCCFNNTFKITPMIFSAWLNILQSSTRSVLWLLEDNPISKENLLHFAELKGIDKKRIIFAPRLPRDAHLNRLKLADLFLDTFPYGAHTTSSDALRANLPVLTIMGKSFASRVGASLLYSINLSELITNSVSEYQLRALDILKSPEVIQKIKNKLKNKASSSPLFDCELFTKNLEKAYFEIYKIYKSQLAFTNIT